MNLFLLLLSVAFINLVQQKLSKLSLDKPKLTKSEQPLRSLASIFYHVKNHTVVILH